jgi:hypothetical protein
MWVSLCGSVLCVGTMFLISWVIAISHFKGLPINEMVFKEEKKIFCVILLHQSQKPWKHRNDEQLQRHKSEVSSCCSATLYSRPDLQYCHDKILFFIFSFFFFFLRVNVS